LWGIPTPGWFWLAAVIAVFHQVFVWFCWRMELYHSWLTRTMGEYAFSIYAAGFAILGIARVAVVFCLAISNQNTIPLDTLFLKVLALIVLIPAVYLFYSVKRFFGFKRAFGIDHFDPSYRSVPFVREGIFRFSGNAMYVYGFLLLWVPALWYASLAAIFIAVFNHIYIWVHYHTTELPDIKFLYGK
ncbi:MAG: methyltransferase, partial [Balneolales bacterium]